MIYKAIQGLPQAHARIKGSKEYPDIRGNVYLYEVYNGTVLLGELMGIPEELEKKYGGFFGFHIHEGNACTGDSQDPFADTKGHYNPEKEEHPRHAGDLPPVLSNDGTAWMEIYTGRFYPMDVVGRTIVLHEMPDDFKTQPSGDSGMKIACGEIKAWEQECKNKNGKDTAYSIYTFFPFRSKLYPCNPLILLIRLTAYITFFFHLAKCDCHRRWSNPNSLCELSL